MIKRKKKVPRRESEITPADFKAWKKEEEIGHEIALRREMDINAELNRRLQYYENTAIENKKTFHEHVEKMEAIGKEYREQIENLNAALREVRGQNAIYRGQLMMIKEERIRDEVVVLDNIKPLRKKPGPKPKKKPGRKPKTK